MNILVTGGAGYIGSHTIVELLDKGHAVIAVDNLSNSSEESLRRVAEVTGKEVPLHVFDLRDNDRLEELFTNNQFDGVIHFAGLKAVGESVEKPLEYYRNNIDSTLTLLEVMAKHDVRRLVFSSSATVYGSAPIPYREDSPTGHDITSPYGQTKYFIEQILIDAAKAEPRNEFSLLRYFNPIGAHESGRIGEDPSGIPNNLMPFITQVATGKRDHLSVFGDDYDTRDGTCVRDYIHVMDLAEGHVAALTHSRPGAYTYNLGSGSGTSVLELVHAFENATGQKIAYEIAPRREGDLPEFYADPGLAAATLDWHTHRTIEDACRDAWKWQSENPDGYSA